MESGTGRTPAPPRGPADRTLFRVTAPPGATSAGNLPLSPHGTDRQVPHPTGGTHTQGRRPMGWRTVWRLTRAGRPPVG
ncbi:hypothetical protein D8771_06025 [Streptomyces albus]|uniref:Uncharacterized protein n=1 Tax=Streptomyces albus TaxID=1888 RepID=A0A8H1LLJ4_9ACTN|nr:hypothetical protein D8771_06025 [Streptomyces albus]